MIYLVSKNTSLFSPVKYKTINFDRAIDMLNLLREVQIDTETEGLDCHTKKTLTIQLGCTDNQVVFDWATMTQEEKIKLKEYLESDRLFIGHNLMFDLTFLYKQNIWIKHIYDTMVAEQLIYLGYPRVLTVEAYNDVNIPGYEFVQSDDPKKKSYYELSYSLKSTAHRRINVDIDKTVRGKIINDGLTTEVVTYAAGDVMWLEKIKEKQLEELSRQDLLKAVEFECEFIKSLAYTKYCGVHLDSIKWQDKMDKDLKKYEKAIKELNEYVIKLDLDEYLYRIPKNKKEENKLNELGFKRFDEHRWRYYIKDKFTYTNYQGSLFDGFDTSPKCNINWGSSKQVIPLFELLGIQVDTFDKKTKKKKKSIEEKQIAPQADQFPIISIFLRYQEAAKVVSTYGQNWLNAINPATRRVHAELHSIGTDTGRISSGGGPYKVNILNLPRDAETRSCFTAEKGNLWASADYTGQESAITASTSADPVMIKILEEGGDLHSEVAKACWPDILGNLSDSEIKKQHKDLRQLAKAVEFAIFYGGDDNTLVHNSGFKPEEAKRIYNSFMERFKGIKKYQDYCRAEVMKRGYILMDPILKHRAHIFDAEWLFKMQNRFKEDGFWQYYNEMKRDYPSSDTVQNVKKYFKRKADSEKQSINYRIQHRGACAFKLAMIKLFNWIVSNKYQNIVKICVTPYDEINLEYPESMKEIVPNILIKCMVEGGRPFCPKVYLGADVEVSDHWVH